MIMYGSTYWKAREAAEQAAREEEAATAKRRRGRAVDFPKGGWIKVA